VFGFGAFFFDMIIVFLWKIASDVHFNLILKTDTSKVQFKYSGFY
jgi:hypothetical protein